MTTLHRIARMTVTAGLALGALGAQAAGLSDDKVKIGVLTDMSGVYSDTAGRGSVVAAQMAIEDFGGTILGKPIELVSADHQQKTDLGATIARDWFDRGGVDTIFDLNNTAVHLAVAELARDKNRLIINTGAGSSSITGASCNPAVVHYTWDTYALATGTAKTLVEQGGKRWYLIAVDYAYGHALANDLTTAVTKAGGTVLGTAKHPLNTTDFSSYVLSAQASGADVIGLANGVNDTVNAIKTANEFGVPAKQKIAAPVMFITDIHGLGLETTQGMYATAGYYWDRTEATRAWSRRFFERHQKMPTMIHAGTYSAVTQYLNAIKTIGADDAKAVLAELKRKPIKDFFTDHGVIRDDGRMVHDMYLVRVKKPSESRYPWDYYEVVGTIPGDQAFRPMSEGKCPMVAGK